MRNRLPLLIAGVCLAATSSMPTASARLFIQSYGATIAGPDGGSVWNQGQDFFVPRTCDSCHYDLFSACKQSHTRSVACRNLHPVYGGYCTPYGACRYMWRDHVYQSHCCGCTPLRCCRGPWRLEDCGRHGRCVLPGGTGGCGGSLCGNDSGPMMGGDFFAACGLAAVEQTQYVAQGDELPNVEPLAGIVLGKMPIALLGVSRGGGGGGAASGGSMPSVGGVAIPGMMPGGGGMSAPPSSQGGSSWPAGF